jgi:hypothetical protein
MFNNDLTYSKKWETEENLKAHHELERKFFDRSIAYPSCPISWAPEVLELLSLIDKELGIERNTDTMCSYRISGKPSDWFLLHPIKGAFNAFISGFLKPKPEWKETEDSILKKIFHIYESFTHPFGYGFKALKIKYVNKFLNYIFSPKVRLSQIKEKYGDLTLYIDAPDAFDGWINEQIKKTKIKLSIKGAYYSLEQLYDQTTITYHSVEHNPDLISIENCTNSLDDSTYTKVSKTIYRKLMQDMGLDLNEVAVKAMLKAQKKEVR